MVESVNSSTVQSTDDRNKMFLDWRKQLQSSAQNEQNNKNISTERKSQFLSNSDMLNRAKKFLSNEDIANRETPFLTNEISSEDRPQPFLQPADTQNAKSPLELNQEEESDEIDFTVNNYTLPKNDSTILSELKRNPMRSTMTIRDIANEYELSYQKATDIYKTLNQDSNGVVREFNLPDRNATVSYLV